MAKRNEISAYSGEEDLEIPDLSTSSPLSDLRMDLPTHGESNQVHDAPNHLKNMQAEGTIAKAPVVVEQDQPVVLLERISPEQIRVLQQGQNSHTDESDDETSFAHPKFLKGNLYIISSGESTDNSTEPTTESSDDESIEDHCDNDSVQSITNRQKLSISTRRSAQSPLEMLEITLSSDNESTLMESRQSRGIPFTDLPESSFRRNAFLQKRRHKRATGFAVPPRILPPSTPQDVIAKQAIGLANLEANLRRKAAKISKLEETVDTLQKPDNSFDAKLRAAFLKEKELEIEERRFVLQQKRLTCQQQSEGWVNSNYWKTPFHTAFQCTFKPSLSNIEKVYRILKGKFPSATGKDFGNHRIRLYFPSQRVMSLETWNGTHGDDRIIIPGLG